MKKLISILLVSNLAIGMAGCQGSTQEEAEQETITEEVVEEPEEEVVEETVEEPESISLGEQVEVNTEYGDFLLTVDNVRKCDWVERIGNEADKYVAVLVECDVENISYEDPYNDAFWIDQFLTSTDDDGYVVSALGYGYDDGLYSASTTLEIPVGSKGRIFVAYNCGIDIQNLTIDINGQYVLETQIEDEVEEEVVAEPEDISLGEQVEVNTEYGDFLLTVDNVRQEDWLSYFVELGLVDAEDFEDDSVTVLVECDVDNTGYEDPSSAILDLDNYISVTDNEGRDAEYFGYGIDDGNYTLLAELEIGEEGGIVVPFICKSGAQSLNININSQYVLEVQLQNSDDADKETEENSSSEYGLDQLVGYNSLVELPEGSPVTVSGVAKEVALGIYVMEIFTEDTKDIGNSNLEQKSIYILDPEQTQSYDNRYISVNGHTDLSNNMPAVIAETITDESESYIEAGGTLPE